MKVGNPGFVKNQCSWKSKILILKDLAKAFNVEFWRHFCRQMLNKLNFWNVIGSRCQTENKKLRLNFTL